MRKVAIIRRQQTGPDLRAIRRLRAAHDGYLEPVLESGRQHAFETSEIEGTADVRGRRASVVWTASGLVGDAELLRRLERAHGGQITSGADFLRALRMVDASARVGGARPVSANRDDVDSSEVST